MQAWVWSAGQAPAPLQEAASVAVPLAQEALRHEVELPGYAQEARFEPSQLPPQALPSEVQAAWPVAGAWVP